MDKRGCPCTFRLTQLRRGGGRRVAAVVACELWDGHPGFCRRSMISGGSTSTLTWDGMGTKSYQTELSLEWLGSRKPGG